METSISPQLQEKIDYILGKNQESISGSGMKNRFKSMPENLKADILKNHEFQQALIDYIIAKKEDEKISTSAIASRINSTLPEEIKLQILKNNEVQQAMVDNVIAKDQPEKISLNAAKGRLSKLPVEVQQDIANNPEVLAAFPEILN